MAIVKQVIKGRTVRTLEVDASEANIADLVSILAGEVSLFELKSEGGSTSPLPATMNRKRFSCGNRTQKISCSFNVPHVKNSAYINDFETAVIGNFDADYESSIKADYCNLLYDRN